jgi:APA family basic amino acid/polyamine antiporter
VTIVPIFPVKTVAVLAALILTGLNLVGIKQSTTVNNVLVIIKIAILALFISFGIFQVHPQNYSEISPNGFFGILQGAGFIFFAYLGFGRIATLGEEVKKPEKTLPRAILIALSVSIIIYILVGLTATGLVDYRILAQSGSPIAVAANSIGNPTLVAAVALGALIATASVLLTNLIGLSRVSYAMARDGQLPKTVAKVSSKYGTPYVSILVMGAILVVLTFALDLIQAAAITSFALLATHVVVNLSAIRLRKKMSDSTSFRIPFYPLVPVLGLGSCIILMFSLPQESWIVAAIVVTISAILYLLKKKLESRNNPFSKPHSNVV